MTVPNEIIKTELFEQFTITNIKKEPDIVEIDEQIFLSGISASPKEPIDSNINECFEDSIIVYDEIVKEEPVFYDANESQIVSIPKSEEDLSAVKITVPWTIPTFFTSKPKEDKIFECHICRCQTDHIGLLKWHLQERHPQPIPTQTQRPQNSNPKTPNVKQPNLKKKNLEKNVPEKKPRQRKSKKIDQKPTIHSTKQNSTSQIGEKINVCKFCGRSFINLHRLENHERVHRNEQPFKCSLCPKKYNTKVSLQTHMRIHSGILSRFPRKPVKIVKNIEQDEFLKFHKYECYMCTFNGLLWELQAHMKEDHTGEKVFKCKTCSKKFLRKPFLKTHMRLHAKIDTVECEVCGKVLACKENLTIHMRYHTGNYLN